jgi:hypothetical protein
MERVDLEAFSVRMLGRGIVSKNFIAVLLGSFPGLHQSYNFTDQIIVNASASEYPDCTFWRTCGYKVATEPKSDIAKLTVTQTLSAR